MKSPQQRQWFHGYVFIKNNVFLTKNQFKWKSTKVPGSKHGDREKRNMTKGERAKRCEWHICPEKLGTVSITFKTQFDGHSASMCFLSEVWITIARRPLCSSSQILQWYLVMATKIFQVAENQRPIWLNDWMIDRTCLQQKFNSIVKYLWGALTTSTVEY